MQDTLKPSSLAIQSKTTLPIITTNYSTQILATTFYKSSKLQYNSSYKNTSRHLNLEEIVEENISNINSTSNLAAEMKQKLTDSTLLYSDN